MKKLLLIVLIFTGTISYAQGINYTGTPKSKIESTITEVGAYPNPLTIKTNFVFTSSKTQDVTVTVKNLVGNTIFAIKVSVKTGVNTVLFERNNLPKGMYIYSIQTETELISKRLVIK